MDQLTHLVTFARVVQAGGFASGARRLGLTASVASKHVAKLERSIGAKLLHRSTRKITLTDAGAAYYEHCARILEEVEQSRLAVAQLQAEPAGVLRVSCLISFANTGLVPLLPEFFARYPKIELDIVLSDKLIDLAEDGFDVALRVTAHPPPNAVARVLAPVHFIVCASPEYLQQQATPQQPMDLVAHRCLGFYAPSHEKGWRLSSAAGPVQVPVNSVLRINSVEALRQLALRGEGIALVPGYAVAEDLREQRLVHLLPAWRGYEASALHAVYLPNRYGSPKLRAFVDYLAEKLAPRSLPVQTTARKPATKKKS